MLEKFFRQFEEIKVKLIWVGLVVPALAIVGVPIYVFSTREDVCKPMPLKCEPLTAYMCQKECEPFKVFDYKPGFYLRTDTDGGVRLFTSCRNDSKEPSELIFADACECGTM